MSTTTTQSSDPAIVRIENARLSFPALFEPRGFEDSKPAYQATLILNKKTHAALIKKLQAASAHVKQEQWKGKTPKLLSDTFRDGSEKPDLDGYGDDVVFLSCRSTKRVPVVARDLTPLTAEDGKPYAGCYVNATVRLWAQDNKYGKRINVALRAIQFLKDGEPFGEKPADVESEFESLPDEESVV